MAELKGNKWTVENVKGKQDIVVNATEHKQSVLLFKCEDTVVTVKGKVTSISIDNCKKTAVIFDNVIATMDCVNSTKIQVQCNGSVPSMSVDKSNGVNIFILSEEGKKVEIVSSASTEINVTTPGKTTNDDPLEQPIPTQYVTKFDDKGKLVTKPSEHVGV